MKTIAIYNIKGGDGKTTTAKHLAVGLAKKGIRILLADADGQANCSKSFIDKKIKRDPAYYESSPDGDKEAAFIRRYMNQDHGATISTIFESPKAVSSCIQHTSYANLDIIPSDLTLYLADTKLRLSDGTRENKLKRATNFIKNEYDYMIFDCSPVKSLVSVNVLYTEPLVIIPVSPADDSMQGLALTLNEINALKDLYEDLDIDYRILIVKRKDNIEYRENIAEIRSAFGGKVFQTMIRDQSKPVEKAVRERKTVLDLPSSSIADDYRNFLDELEVMLHD